MNKEIKEILDKLNNKAEHYILYDYEVKVLKDYITNLEQEKQEMKNGWQQEVYNKDEILNRWYETQGRIDKAIEYIRSEYTITDDDLYLALYSSDGTLDKLEKILTGGDEE